MGRKKQNECGECQDHGVLNVMKSRSLLYDSVKSNDGKEVDDIVDRCINSCVYDIVDVAVEDGVDGGETHLTHLTEKVDCSLMGKKKQNECSECQDHEGLNVTKSRN
eukprot:7853253-Ditylum_brightwellii.AAC.1